MSEHFTHIAVYEDSARLLLASPDINKVFKHVLNTQYDSGLLGSTSRGNHLFAIPILEKYKDAYQSLNDTTEADIKIAYAIGWLTHRASDLQMKPVFRKAEADPDPRFTYQLSSIYHDAMSFRKVYDGGKAPSRSENEVLYPATFDFDMQSHPAADALDIPAVEPLLSWMWQKDMIEMHVFLHQEKDFDKWLDTFVERFADFSENFSDYEKVYNDPDPALIDRHWVQDRLYFDDDPVIQFVRAVQKGEESEHELDYVLQEGVNQSEYGQAIRNGYWFVKVASDYFIGQATKEEAYDACKMNEQFRF